jgi:hypothetical protein
MAKTMSALGVSDRRVRCGVHIWFSGAHDIRHERPILHELFGRRQSQFAAGRRMVDFDRNRGASMDGSQRSSSLIRSALTEVGKADEREKEHSNEG